jgi:uncharacterized protein (DUF2147 family)
MFHGPWRNLPAVLAAAVVAVLPPVARAADARARLATGNWLTQPDGGNVGIIAITIDAQDRMEGRIVGGNHPGLKDEHNSDPARRGLELRGEVILKDMRYDGEGRWSGGTIYRVSDGRTFKCLVKLDGDAVLRVRGYIGLPRIGETQTWTRYSGSSMDLSRGGGRSLR